MVWGNHLADMDYQHFLPAWPEAGTFAVFPTTVFKSAATNRVLSYWDSKRGARLRPKWSDFDLIDIFDVAPTTIIKDVIDGGESFVNRYWGTQMVEILGIDATGKSIPDNYSEKETEVFHWMLRRALESVTPVRVLADMALDSKTIDLQLEGIILPLDGEEREKEHLVLTYAFGYALDDEDRALAGDPMNRFT